MKRHRLRQNDMDYDYDGCDKRAWIATVTKRHGLRLQQNGMNCDYDGMTRIASATKRHGL
jgi:hypothetical protein